MGPAVRITNHARPNEFPTLHEKIEVPEFVYEINIIDAARELILNTMPPITYFEIDGDGVPIDKMKDLIKDLHTYWSNRLTSIVLKNVEYLAICGQPKFMFGTVTDLTIFRGNMKNLDDHQISKNFPKLISLKIFGVSFDAGTYKVLRDSKIETLKAISMPMGFYAGREGDKTVTLENLKYIVATDIKDTEFELFKSEMKIRAPKLEQFNYSAEEAAAFRKL